MVSRTCVIVKFTRTLPVLFKLLQYSDPFRILYMLGLVYSQDLLDIPVRWESLVPQLAVARPNKTTSVSSYLPETFLLCTLGWISTAGIWLYCDYFIWVYLALCFNLFCGGFILFCNVCVCVFVCVCVCVCVGVLVIFMLYSDWGFS